MQALKVSLSVLALLVGAAAGLTQIGGWNVTPAVTELLLSAGAALALLGVTPIVVPPLLARVLGAVSVVMISALAAHAGADGGSSLLMKVGGFVAILLGLVAKFPIQAKPSAPSAAIVLWLALGVAVAPGCATTANGKPPSMGCLDVLAKDCDDPSAYPPLVATLPPWPFPRLIQPLPEAGEELAAGNTKGPPR